MATVTPHLFWITSRAAGITAMVLASMSVGLGLSMAGRLGRSRLSDRKVLHEALSIGVMLAIAVHGLSLIGDSYLSPSLADVTIPFVSGYKTLWTSLGIISGWGLILLGLSFYARKRIGMSRWKMIHRFTLVVWAGGLIHSIGEGTDAGETWFLALLALTTAPPLLLLGARVSDALSRRTPATATPSAA